MKRFVIALLLWSSVVGCSYDRIHVDPDPDPDFDAGIGLDGPLPDSGPIVLVPQPIFPAANAYTGRGVSSVKFSWSRISTSTSSYTLEISESPSFAVLFGSVQTLSTSEIVDLPVRTTVPVGTRYYWRVRSCYQGSCREPSTPRIVNVGRAERDFNGDGYSDVVVGAPFGNIGKAYVYFGGATGIGTTPAGTLQSGGLDAFGHSVASAGDVNGDGFFDVIVGAPAVSPGGKAFLYFGGAGTTFNATADWSVTGASGDQLGYSVSSAGDVNGDGAADVVVGAFTYGGISGRAYLYLGALNGVMDTIPDATPTGGSGERLGIAVASAGDVDNDGKSDVLVSTIAGSGELRRLYLYWGSSDGLSPTRDTLYGKAFNDFFGGSAALAGDVDADGSTDVVVGATGGAAAYLYLGQRELSTSKARTIPMPRAMSAFGSSVFSAGDVNGDGFDDFVIGASVHSANGTNAGAAHVYLGSASPQTVPVATVLGAAGDELGTSVASAGDVNGDGFDDLIVGSPGANQRAGKVSIYHGAAGASFDMVADRVLNGAAGSEEFGFSVGR